MVGSLAALLLHVSGRRVAAAIVLLLAALSKETALVTPAIALLIDHRADEPWSRTAKRLVPLGVAATSRGRRRSIAHGV